jgi:hypothetical protein
MPALGPASQIGPSHWRKVAGTAVSRLLVPAWVLAGAVFKLVERNPALLPPPVRNFIDEIGSALGVADPAAWLVLSMRAIIGVELAAVAVMVLFPRLSRAVAASLLSLFLLVLSFTLWEGYAKGGLAGMLADCGCFGSKGPNAVVMFICDAVLLGLVAAFPVPLSANWPKIERRTMGATAVVAIAGLAVAFAVPLRTVASTDSDDGGDAGIVVPSPGDGTAANPWVGRRPDPEPVYFDRFERWVGTPLSDHKLALQISRPLPEGFPEGKWHLVFYREDCDHCHELLELYFAGPLDTPAIAIKIPDSSGTPLEMPCTECHLHSLAKGPNYVIASPILLTVVDGVVVCAVENVDDADLVANCLDAK